MTHLNRRSLLVAGLVLALVAGVGLLVGDRLGLGVPSGRRTFAAGTTAPTQPCPTDRVTRPRGVASHGSLRAYRKASVSDHQVHDLRGVTIVGYPTVQRYPLMIGKRSPGRSTCLLGGTVTGQQSRELTWQTMKRRVDGDGLNFKSYGGVVDGVRIDNVEDGIATTGKDPGGIIIRNAYLSYIRDDCIENDWIVQLRVEDSLLDGCFNGLSERPGPKAVNPQPAPPEETTTLEGVLLRLQPMPYEKAQAQCPANGRDGLGSSTFFKWSRYANRLVVRNSVLLAERNSVNCSGSMHLPLSGRYENVTLVWLGPGDYPGRLPSSGVAVTGDRSVWDEARVRWLLRHGYPA